MSNEERQLGDARPDRPLKVAALVKQVPLAESLALGPDGRLRRTGMPLEMNPYCRRAVSKGTELARTSGGSCTVFTLGPPTADDVLREAVAWGADEAVHLSDPRFAGSDTLATARALSAALRREGPFDLVLVGRNSTDGDTGQVGPEIAQLLDLPFAAGVRRMGFVAGALLLDLEQDDGVETVEIDLPALLSVAERLIEPAKVDPEGRRSVAHDRVRRLSAAELGEGPWGEAGSPTRVGTVRVFHHQRAGKVLSGDVAEQVAEAVTLLAERDALEGHQPVEGARQLAEEAERSRSSAVADRLPTSSTLAAPDLRAAPSPTVASAEPVPVVVVVEAGRPWLTAELLAAARELADEVGGRVAALAPPERPAPDDEELASELGAVGADEVLRVVPPAGPGYGDGAPDEGAHRVGGPAPAAEDVAGVLTRWAGEHRPWLVLAPSTAFGREVAARTAAALGSGLVGDAVGLAVVDGDLVSAKPAFSGALVADIACTSPVQLVTVRPGVLSPGPTRPRPAAVVHLAAPLRGRVRRRAAHRDDDLEVLARADVVIGVGTGVTPEEYPQLGGLAAALGAELAATRKVTDRGWAPRSRQVGITGRSIAPRLYVAIGLSGKFNHMVGVRAAGTVLAVNSDPAAPVFAHADIGIVGDWHEAVPLLTSALRRPGSDRGPAGIHRGPAGHWTS